jgi:hypothetical protein
MKLKLLWASKKNAEHYEVISCNIVAFGIYNACPHKGTAGEGNHCLLESRTYLRIFIEFSIKIIVGYSKSKLNIKFQNT